MNEFHVENRTLIAERCRYFLSGELEQAPTVSTQVPMALKYRDFRHSKGTLENLHTKTWPLLAHAPGVARSSPLWKELSHSALEARFSGRLPSEVTLITCGDSTTGILEESCKRLGVPLLKLGSHIAKQDWINRGKIELIHQQLSKITTPYVLYCDNHDVVILKSL